MSEFAWMVVLAIAGIGSAVWRLSRGPIEAEPHRRHRIRQRLGRSTEDL